MKLLLLTTLIPLLFNPAYAQSKKGSFKDWFVYTQKKEGKLLCYMVSYPIKSTGTYSYRSSPHLMITHLNSNTDEVSTTSGYKYKPGTEPRVSIDGEKYRMAITQGEHAWIRTRQYDRILVEKMKKGSRTKITGTSPKGTYSIDTYSLSGFTKAYRKMKTLCKNSNFKL